MIQTTTQHINPYNTKARTRDPIFPNLKRNKSAIYKKTNVSMAMKNYVRP